MFSHFDSAYSLLWQSLQDYLLDIKIVLDSHRDHIEIIMLYNHIPYIYWNFMDMSDCNIILFLYSLRQENIDYLLMDFLDYFLMDFLGYFLMDFLDYFLMDSLDYFLMKELLEECKKFLYPLYISTYNSLHKS